MLYVGIDPGKQGGFAVIQSTTVLLHRMPTSDEEILRWVRVVLCDQRGDGEDISALMEQVGGYVGEGQPGSAMFNFGDNNGAVRMAFTACGFKPELVLPHAWQKGLGIPPRRKQRLKVGMIHKEKESKSEWKARLRRKAEELFPWLKVPLWAADALLIARYLQNQQEGV